SGTTPLPGEPGRASVSESRSRQPACYRRTGEAVGGRPERTPRSRRGVRTDQDAIAGGSPARRGYTSGFNRGREQFAAVVEKRTVYSGAAKALLRCLIDKVVIHRIAADRVRCRVVWRDGETTTADVP